MSTDRVMLFVDDQNSYWAARNTFHHAGTPWFWEGQFNPMLVGEHIVASSPFDRSLAGVRVYRGLPSAKYDRKGYGAARAQIDAWRGAGVTVVSRPLRYPPDYPQSKAEEKGIDVALAVDFVMGAVEGWYDVGIVMSLDTDLQPALESVASELHGIRVEVAAWMRPDIYSPRLVVKGIRLWCHWLGPSVYEAVKDESDYTS